MTTQAQPRRVLIVLNVLGRAGAEAQVAHLALQLAATGNQVTVACIRDVKADPAPLLDAGIRVVPLNAFSRWARLLTVPRLMRLARRSDVVHCHTYDATLWGRVAAALARRPAIMTEHSGGREIQVSRSGRARGRWIAWHNRLLDRFTFAVVACATVQIPTLESEGVSPEKILHIPNGVPIDAIASAARNGQTREALGIPAGAKIVVHVARFLPEKNQDATLDLVAWLRAELGDVHALFVGDGRGRQAVEARAEAMGASWAHFVGRREDVPSLLALADVAVLPSLVEAMPMTVLEAMAVGVPQVASDVGDVREVLEDTGAGVAVAVNDREALRGAARDLLSDSALHARVSARARASRHFDAATMAGRYSDLYEAAVAGKPAQAADWEPRGHDGAPTGSSASSTKR